MNQKMLFNTEFVFPTVAALCVLLLGLFASGCGGGGTATTGGATSTITGSAGDGPIVGGLITVTDVYGTTVTTIPASPKSDPATAKFSFSVPVSSPLPLTINVYGGMDQVTGLPQDFPLKTAVDTLPAAGATANANPLSTLIVESALAKGNGKLSKADIATATTNILGSVGFGLAVGINPITTPVSNSNVASVLKANEAVAEMIRRTHKNSGLSLADAIISIGQDLTDGYADGKVAVGADSKLVSDRYTSQMLTQQAQISSELLVNNLQVTKPDGTVIAAASGANFVTKMNAAITGIGNSGSVNDVYATKDVLDQARSAIAAVKKLTPTKAAKLDDLLAGINGVAVGVGLSTTQESRLKGLVSAAGAAFADAYSTGAKSASLAGQAAKLAVNGKVVVLPIKPVFSSSLSGVTNNNRPTFSGTATADAYVSVSVDGYSHGIVRASAGGSWSLASIQTLTDGVRNIYAAVVDEYGHISPFASATITVDTTAPAAPVISSPTGGSTSTIATPTVSGTAEAGAVIDLYSNGNVHWNNFATADSNGNWSATTQNITNGTATFDAYATDAAGNVSAKSTSVMITIAVPVATGAVIDGRVSGSTLTLFSDQAMTTQVGSGSTDSYGAFQVNLTTTTMPSPIYIKATGGTDIDTGMPAPTMRFIADTSGTNGVSSFNITPITDDIFDRVDKGDAIAAAQTNAKAAFGLSAISGGDGLYDDPSNTTNNPNLKAAEFKKLTAGTTGSTITEGKYHMFAISVDARQVQQGTAIANIAALIDPNNGLFVDAYVQVDNYGTISGYQTGVGWFTGKVVGAAMMFDIIDSQSSPTKITRVVGNIGLSGSVAGNFTDISNLKSGTPSLVKGVFVGSLVPAAGVKITGLASFVSSFYTPGATTGAMNIVARDLYSTGVPRVLWGKTAVTAVDVAAGSVTMSSMDMYTDAGSKANTTSWGTNGVLSFSFTAGQYVKNSKGIPTNLLVFEYATSTNHVFVATSVGLRRGIYFVTNPYSNPANKVISIGESYLSKMDSLAPSGFTAGASHDVTTASIHPGMPGSPRQSSTGQKNGALDQGLIPTSIGQTMTIPSTVNVKRGFLDTTSGAQELMVFQGSMFVMKDDANNLFDGNFMTAGADGYADHLRVVEFFESGAMQGEEVEGGTISFGGNTIQMRANPSNFVGFVHVTTAANPKFSGKLHLLARTMYAKSYAAFANSYVTGTIAITAPTTTVGSATLVATAGGQTASSTSTLTVDVPATGAPGVYHMHGALGTTEYIDITWPIGGTKALWAISDKADGTGIITEVGEAYITQ